MDYAGYHFNGFTNFNTWLSTSFQQRQEIFRNSVTKKFSAEPVTFVGNLFHDLQSCGTGNFFLNFGAKLHDIDGATNYFVFVIRSATRCTSQGCFDYE